MPVGRPEQREMLSWLLQTEAGHAATSAMPAAVVDALAAATAA